MVTWGKCPGLPNSESSSFKPENSAKTAEFFNSIDPKRTLVLQNSFRLRKLRTEDERKML